MSRPRISWWRLWSMRNELLKDQEPVNCQSESKKVKYKPKTQRKLGTRLTPGMERQRRTTKPEIFPLKVFEEHVSKRILECKAMLSKTVENIRFLFVIEKLEYEGPSLKDKLCEGNGEIQEHVNQIVENVKVEAFEGLANIEVKDISSRSAGSARRDPGMYHAASTAVWNRKLPS